MPSVAIVTGHHPDSPGANLELEGFSTSEYEFWKPLARELANTLEHDLQRLDPTGVAYVIERPNERPDSELTNKINATGADCAIELHFNSFSDPSANGTEMLHWHSSSEGKSLAHELHERTITALGTRGRGLKQVSSGGRGDVFLGSTRMPAVICEPAFGSNPEDAWKLLTGQADLLRAYREAIIDFLA